ncbi:MAG: mechanosensitive ion channel family protein, partial [Phaeodactylibacter sp.]|nr:mechanosensitive ion channel family protein [Phaeodactylibacter sp.]
TTVMVLLRIISVLLFILISLRILDVVLLYVGRVTAGTNSKLDDQLLPIVKRTVQVIIVILGIVQILRLMDVNITALIAGISIGGLALALAAQDTVKNLIGSAMIFVDRPFQIGDWIQGSDFAGAVMEVGFRTTRIQTLDSSIISVPNGTIANMSVTNLGVRVFRIYNTTLGITYSSTPEQVEQFMTGLRQMIQAHPLIMPEGFLVRFTELANSSLNIMFRCRIQTNDYDEELRVKQELNLGFLRLARAVGVSFAFPSTSVYVESMAAAAEAADNSPAPTSLDAFVEDFKKRVEAPPQA